jgi:hypothetical protein
MLQRNILESQEMQFAVSSTRRPAASVSWLTTAAIYGIALAAIAALALLGVDESRIALIG